MVAVDDPLPPGTPPGELQRRFHRLRAAVAEVHPVQARGLGQQPFPEQAGQQGGVELDQIGEFGVEHVVQGFADHGVVVADAEDPEAC